VNPRAALLLIPIGFGVLIVAASTAFTMADVARLDLSSEQGSGPNMTLRGGQLYGMQVSGDCDEGSSYDAVFDIVDAQSGVVASHWQALVSDQSKGCGLGAASGEITVPRGGVYFIRWSVPALMAAKHPRIWFHEIPMFLGTNVVCFMGLGAVTAVSAPVFQGILATIEHRRKRAGKAQEAAPDGALMVARVANSGAGETIDGPLRGPPDPPAPPRPGP
jgi:hypothetical protein